MQESCSRFSKFLSKVFCSRRHTTVESPSPSPISFPRRRKHSPEPSRVRRMVANMNENAQPQLVEIVNVDLMDCHQRAQFSDPYGVVWEICWDSHRQTPVLLGGVNGPNRMVDCEGTNKMGWQITVKDVLKMLGYEIDYEAANGIRLVNVWMQDQDVEVRDMVEMTVENMPLSQFDVNINIPMQA